MKPASRFWSDCFARRVPSSPVPGRRRRGGLLRPAELSVLCLLAFLVFPSWVSARAENAFEPVALRVVVPQAAQGEDREVLYWRAVGQGWLRALGLVAPRLPGVGELEAGPFPAQFRLALAAAASDVSRGALRVCEPPSEPGVPLDAGGTPAMCVLRPGAVTISVRALPDARERIARLLADSEQAAVWQRLLTEMEQAVQTLGTDGADSDQRRAAACVVQALLGDVRQLLPEAAEGWLAGAQSMPLLEELAERVPESALVRLLLAEARLRAGLPQQCMEAASAALRRAPDMTRARYVRALAHWRLQQLALAEEDLDAALRATPAPVGSAAHDALRRGILRARGALRSGAGLVTAAMPAAGEDQAVTELHHPVDRLVIILEREHQRQTACLLYCLHIVRQHPVAVQFCIHQRGDSNHRSHENNLLSICRSITAVVHSRSLSRTVRFHCVLV